MPITHVRSFSNDTGGTSTASSTLTVTVPAGGVAAGNLLILACGRGDTAGSPGGVASVTDARGNTYTVNAAFGLRANTVESSICYSHITTALLDGDTITVTWNDSAARRIVIAHEFNGVTTVDRSSNSTVGDNVNTGANGSSANPTASTGATTVADELVFAAFGSTSGGGAFTPGSGYTAGLSIVTTTGTSDRRLSTEYKVVAATGAQTADGTLAASVGWSGAVVTFSGAAQQVLVPTTDITTSAWSKVGGTGTFASCLDESVASDADYVTSPNNPSSSVFETKLSAGSDPNTDSGFAVAYRVMADATSSTVVAGLYQGATLIASETRTNVPAGFTTYTLSVSSGQAANITDFTDLRLRFTVTAS